MRPVHRAVALSIAVCLLSLSPSPRAQAPKLEGPAGVGVPRPDGVGDVTATADFLDGNDEGNVSFDEDAISCGRPSGGIVGAWSTSTIGYRLDHASVAYNGYLYLLGGQGLNSVAFAPISGGTAGAWSETTALPGARYHLTAVAYDGFIFVSGGHDGTSALSEVWVAPIHPDGTLGSWAAGPALPGAFSEHSSVAHDGYLYILNGATGQVFFAEIRLDGTLGPWAATTGFPATVSGNYAFVWNGYLNFVDSYLFTRAVRFAPIHADGSVGAWGVAGPPPGDSMDSFAVVAYRGYVYQIGGAPPFGMPTPSVYYAPIYANGKIGPATWTRYAPHDLTHHAVVACGDHLYVSRGSSLYSAPVVPDTPGAPLSCWASGAGLLQGRAHHSTASSPPNTYLIGGKTAEGTTASVERLDARSDGSIAGPYPDTSLPTTLYEHASVAYNGFVYVLGAGVSRDRALRSPIDAFGRLGAWTDIGSFPVGTGWYLDAMVHNGYLYVIGATFEGAPRNVLFAPINGDGSLGSWGYAATGTPFYNYYPRIVIRNGLFYVVGAMNMTQGDVFFAPIHANGTLGNWTQTISMPVPMKRGACAVLNDVLYVMGGAVYGQSTSSDAVVAAPFRADGTLGEWDTLCSLPAGGGAGTATTANEVLYFLGGNLRGSSQTPSDQVQTAHVRSVGTADAWTTSSVSLPTARHYLRAVATNGILYALGGTDSTGYLNQVRSAPIGPGGGLGAWVTRAPFATPRVNHAVAAHGGFLYVLGGDGSGFKDDVQVARIDADGSL